jgi:HEAT repeat protein
MKALEENVVGQSAAHASSVRTLVRLAEDREHLVIQLTSGLKAIDPEFREAAASELGNLGRQARSAVPNLSEALKDKNEKVRRSAAHSLWIIDQEAARAAGVFGP